MRVSMVDQLLTSIADAGRELLRNRLGARPARDRGLVPRPALDPRRGLRRGAGARGRADACAPCRQPSGWPSSSSWPAASPSTTIGCWPPSRPTATEPGLGHAPGPAPCHRGAPARAVPAHEHGARRHPLAGPPARGAAPPSAGPSGAARRRCRPARAADAAGSTRASCRSPGSTGTARPRCWRSSCATRRSTAWAISRT